MSRKLQVIKEPNVFYRLPQVMKIKVWSNKYLSCALFTSELHITWFDLVML